VNKWEVESAGRHIFVKLRRLVAFLVIATLLIVVLLLVVASMNAASQKENAELINILGKQRMLSQMMAKEASQISVLYTAMDNDSRIESLEVLQGKLLKAQESIRTSAERFDGTYRNILEEKNAVYTGPSVRELGNLWTSYKRNLAIITSSPDNKSETFKKALIYVNGNDLRLLELSDNIINSVMEKNRMDYYWSIGAAVFLLFLLCGFAIYTLRKFYFFLFKPLEELYKGFGELGITLLESEQKKSSKNNLDAVMNEVRDIFKGIREMLELIENINNNVSFRETLDYIFKTFSRFVPYTYIGIAIFTGDQNKKLKASYGVSDGRFNKMAAELVGLTVNLDSTSLGRLMESGKPRVINDLNLYFKSRVINSYSRILLDNGIKSSITLPLRVNGDQQLGFIFFSSDRANVYMPHHAEFLESVSSAVAMSFEKDIFVDELVYSSVLALAKLAEAKDEDTGDHIDRMRSYALKLADLMKAEPPFAAQISPEFLMDIEKFSPMHDIGKVGVPDGVLLKPGKLTVEEFDIMKTHPVFGAEVLRKAEENINKKGRSIFVMGIEIANSHHEKWDGSGYPQGLKGEEIPLSARIVALADVLDALLSTRPYKRAFSFEESVEIILEGRGKHFDPRIVEIFEKNLESFRNIYIGAKY